MSDSGEGRWTVKAAIDNGVPAPVLSAALYERFASRGEDHFANQVLSAMRQQFGGHDELPSGDSLEAGTARRTRRADVLTIVILDDNPKLYLAKMTKALRKGRIFIDYFRNSREATSVAAYSTRSRAGAPVSAPVTWERLSRTNGGNDFSLLDLKKRLKEDAWAEIGKVRQKLPDGASRAGGDGSTSVKTHKRLIQYVIARANGSGPEVAGPMTNSAKQSRNMAESWIASSLRSWQ